MSNTVQSFLAAATRKAAIDIVTALNRIPGDKRNWSPAPGARSALDQIAECTIANGGTADMLAARKWIGGDFEEFRKRKSDDSGQLLIER